MAREEVGTVTSLLTHSLMEKLHVKFIFNACKDLVSFTSYLHVG